MQTKRLHKFHNDGLSFDVIDSGPIEGDIILLLHGWPLNMHCWDKVREKLNAQGLRTLAPNQRGYSSSARPKGRFAYRMGKLVGDIRTLIKQLGDSPVHLVGHDWGATVAWSLASQHPELVRSFTSLSVPHSGAFLRSMLSSDQLLRIYYMGLFQFPLLPEWGMKLWPRAIKAMLVNNGLGSDEAERVYRELVDSKAITGSLNWYRAMPFTDPRSLWSKVAVPTQHLWGDKDTALSRRSAELAGHFVSARYQLRVLSGGTHWLPLQQPQQIADAILEIHAQGN